MSGKIYVTEQQQHEIIERYKSGEDLSSIQPDFPMSIDVLRKNVQSWGIVLRDSRLVFTEDQKAAIIHRYVNLREDAPSLASAFRCGTTSIYRNLEKWGISIRKRKTQFTEEDKSDVIRRYTAGESVDKIAPDMNCSTTVIWRNLKDWGVEPNRPRPRQNLSPNDITKLLELYAEHKTLEQLVETFGVTRGVLARHIREAGGLLRRGGRPQKYFTLNGVKTCGMCKEEKPCIEFTLHSGTSDGLQATCQKCTIARARPSKLLKQFGLTSADYDLMLDSQDGVCAICSQPETRMKFGKPTHLAVDHNRSCCPGNNSCGKCVRGLLCAKCNQGLGQFQDSPVNLRKAAFYLENHGTINKELSQ